MKILVIFTGGTIGSRLQDGWIGPDDSLKYTLIDNYRRATGDSVDFVCLEPYSLLSENLSAKEINLLIKSVCDNLDKGFDGIIVTHGTDTLQYSAAALSYAVGSDSIPVVLVSSGFPLSDPRSNGDINFKAAVEFIKQRLGKGVYAAYKNDGDCVKLHRGTELLSHPESSDFLSSLPSRCYAKFSENGFSILNSAEPVVIEALGRYELCFDPKILVITVHPGDSYCYDLSRYNAVIIRPYHSGTLDTCNPQFFAFCKAAYERNIPVFVTNIPDGAAYESSKAFEGLNVIPLLNSAFINVYVKTWIAISLGKDVNNFVS